jgi:2-oxoglutarate ferredoxin oxidoreductase subunit gamma
MSGDEEPDLIRISSADVAIFMYPKQMEAYSGLVSDEATVFIDSSYTDKPFKEWRTIYLYPFANTAKNLLGNSRVANIVALGYFVGKTELLNLDTVIDVLRESVKEAWLNINIKAFRLGFDEAREVV